MAARDPRRRSGWPRSERSRTALLLACAFVATLAARAHAQAVLPQGGTVASGQVKIGTPTGNSLTINQGSSKAIVDWNSFSVGGNASVNFVQPNSSAAILNRVTGSTPSTIAGQINANGQVFLVNPNGIAITPTGSVQVGGGFVASTLDIGNADFNAGRLNFTGRGASAAVSNAGSISGAPGSFVGLIGGSVSNSGIISVPLGKVGLGAGEKVTLDPTGDGFLQVTVPTGATTANGQALIDVAGRIRASGGSVVIKAATAQQAVRDVVNVSGSVSARSVRGRTGNIVLGGGSGMVTVSGRLAANGGTRSRGGTVVVTGGKVALTSTAKVTANGSSGGTVLIGGDVRGGTDPSVKLVNAPVSTAQTTSIAQGATISANGTSADGGNVVVWSDTQTDFRGSIAATGGSAGKGGAVEVSSHGVLGFRGGVDVTATSGKTGTLLLDPFDVTISAGSDTNISNFANIYSPTGNSSVLSVTTLQTALATANITVITGFSGSQSGNITVADALTWSSSNSLTLTAAGAIAINAPITASSGALTLSAGAPSTAITATAAISVGSLTISQGAWSQNTANLPGLHAGSFSISSNASFLRAAGGSGTVGSPYLLTDIYGVQGIGSSATYLGSSYKLANDVDASVTSAWNGGLGFNPIGTQGFFLSGGYTGTFDGNNYAISNLFINRGSSDSVGLFGYTSGATIQNLNLLNANVTGGSLGGLAHGSGTLVGVADNASTIRNVVVTGAMTGSAAAGGTDCCIGGIVGVLNSGSVLQNSAAAVNVSSAVGRVGGAVGSLEVGGTIQGVSASGSVFAPGQTYVGGLVGSATSNVSNSYATGAVTGGSNVGGFVGFVSFGTISSSYSTGAVSGGFGFAGGGNFGFANFINDYWNTQTSGQATDGVFGTTGLTTAQMLSQASFSGFDFAGTWFQTAGYYPTLRGTTTILGAAPGATGGNLTISSAADTVLTSATTTTNINTTSLQNLLGVGNVLVSTTSGTLDVNNDVTWGSSSLRLASSGALTTVANLTSGSGGNLGLTSSAISINGSSINLGGALSATANASGAATAVNFSNATLSVGPGSSTINGTSSSGIGMSFSGSSSLAANGGGTLALAGTSTSNAGAGLTVGASLATSGNVSLSGTSNTGVGLYFVGTNTISDSAGTASFSGTSQSNQGIWFNGGSNTLTNSGAGSLTLAGSSNSLGGLALNVNTDLTTSGTINLSGTSNSYSGIWLNGTNAITAAGNLTLTGSSTSSTGVLFNSGSNSLTTSGGGMIGLSGTSGSGAGTELNTNASLTAVGSVTLNGTSNSFVGLLLNGGNTVTASSGDLAFNGTSTSDAGLQLRGSVGLINAGATTFAFNGNTSTYRGLELLGAASTNVTVSGDTSISGTSNTGTGVIFGTSSTFGVSSGNVTVSGLSSTAAGTGATLGTRFANASVTNSGNGAVTITGTSNDAGSANSGSAGVLFTNANSLTNSGSGSLSVSGTNTSGYGAQLGTSATLATSGTTSIAGTSSAGTGAYLQGSNTITDAGGALSITGTSTSYRGVEFSNANSLVNTGAGVLGIAGTTASVNTLNNGLELNHLSSLTTSGSVMLSGSSTGTAGVGFDTNTISASSGSLAISGTSGSAAGTTLFAGNTLAASGGATLSISGTSTSGSGILLTTFGSSSVSSSGTTSLSGQSTSGVGFMMQGSNAITASSGSLTINGTTSSGPAGIDTSSAGNTITNNGSGLMALNGTGGDKIGATISSSSGDLVISDTGTVTQSGGTITAGNVLLSGAGAFSLGQANLVGTLAANAGSVSFINNQNLTIGTVQAIAGITAAGTATIQTSGNLTIASGAPVSAASPVLTAAGAFINNAGSAAVTATSGRWLIYSNTPAGNTFGGLDSSNTAIWNATYATLPPGSVTAPGNRYLFAIQPTLTFASTNVTKTYGTDATATVASAYTVSGYQNGVSNAFVGDNAASTFTGGPTVTSTGAPATASVAGSPYAMTIAQGTVAATSGYALAFNSAGTLTVNPAPVTVTALGGASTYGTSPANPGLSATGLQNGQNVSALTGLSNSFGISNTTNAGSYVLSVIGTLTNANYTVAGTNNGNWTVNPAPVTVTALGGASTYGASPANPGLSATGLQNGQNASVLTGLSNSFGITNASNAGNYVLSVIGSLTNTNYTVAGTNNGSWTVNPAPVTVTALGGASTYGASPVNPGLSATGLQNGQNVSVLTGLANSFPIANVSNAGSYTLSVIGSLSNGNYTLAGTNNGSWTVNPAPVTVTALGGSSYVGSSPGNPGLSATGLQNGQGVSALTGLSNSFGITSASSIGSYVMSVVGTLTNGNYKVVGTNSGTWSVTAPNGSTSGATPTFNGPSPSDPNLLIARPSGGSGDSALSGLATSSSANGGAALGGKSSGAGGQSAAPNPSALVATPSPSSPPVSSPPSNLFVAAPAPAPVSIGPSASANASPTLQRGCGGKAGGSGTGADGGGCAAPSPPRKAADVVDFVLSALNRDALVQAVGQQFTEIARSEATPRQILMVSFAGTGVALTLGFVGWLLRGGALVSAFLSSMPLWRGFDPLVIVQRPSRNNGGRRISSRLDTLFDGAGAFKRQRA